MASGQNRMLSGAKRDVIGRAKRRPDVPDKDVLIVDDEVDVRDLFAHILEQSGYLVDVAATFAEAAKLLSKYRYGVVVADWRLPDGDGGVIANLATEAGSCAFVMSGHLPHMLSGHVDPRQTLMKPVRPSELLAIVHASIGEATVAGGSKNPRLANHH